MPNDFVHSFVVTDTFVNYTFVILYNTDTDAITLIDSNGWAAAHGGSQLNIVSEAQMGLPDGFIERQFCRGTILIKIKIRLNISPFAVVEYEMDNPTCAPPPPCALEISNVIVTNETVLGDHDGTVTIQTTGGVNVKYSLDGVTWQTEGFFFGLVPGNYIAYTKGDTNCSASTPFILLAGPSLASIVYPWKEKFCHFFRLLFPDGSGGYTQQTIREPGKWDGINFIGKRNRDWHGYRGMFSDGIVELDFDCPAGMDEIKAAYDTFGNDAVVLFRFGYTYLGTDHILFPGKINFNTYKEFPGRVSASVEREDFNTLFESRFDSKVNMASNEGFDGAAISPATIIDFILTAKEIVRNYLDASPDLQTTSDYFGSGTLFYVQPDTSAPTANEIQEGFGYPLGTSIEEPVASSKFNWKLAFAGVYDFSLIYNIDLTITRVTEISPSVTYTIKTFFRVNGTATQIGATISGSFPSSVSDVQTAVHNLNINGSFPGQNLVIDDKVYFYTVIEFSGTFKGFLSLRQNSTNISVTSLERSPDSVAKGWLLFDVVDTCIKAITNNTSRLRSAFLSTSSYLQPVDGGGSLYFVTNGKQIRQFDILNSPLQISLKDALNTVKNIFCIGYGIEKNGAAEIVRVERVNYFYRNKQITVIESVSEYREEVAKDLLYNELEFGYEKFQDSGYNTLDEFNTRHEYVTPIKTNKLKLTAKSVMIASGYSIETSRRQQFSTTATDSFQNDDDPFIISVKRSGAAYVPERNESFQAVSNVISPNTAYNLRISPIRQLLNWAIWLRNVFHYKAGTEVIKNTYVAQNGELITDLFDTEINPVGDINKTAWQEKQNISLTNYAVDERIWRPDYIFFKTRLTPDIIQIIDESMRGNWSVDTDYGYIVVKDHNGEYQGGFLEEIEYNYSTEVCSMTLLKKYDSPVVPGADCCEYLVINGCYIKVNGNKIIV